MSHRLTKWETLYWVSPILAFSTVKLAAQQLGVSTVTLTSWVKGQSTAAVHYKSRFKKATDNLKNYLKGKADGDDFCKNALEYLQTRDPPPPNVTAADEPKDWLVNFLEKKLTNEARVYSKPLVREAVANGYTRAKVYRVAKQMGINTMTVGYGINQKSYWTLEPDPDFNMLCKRLEAELIDGPMLGWLIRDRVADWGYSERQLRRAKKHLDIHSYGIGFGKNKKNMWGLKYSVDNS